MGKQQPPPYAPNQSMHITVAQQPTVQIVTPVQLGPEPMHTVCPHCHAQIMTNVRHEPSSKTHLYALISCLLGGWCCVCIPYCVDSCQNANHYCPACESYLGAYQN